ncbi:uncharacterized protein MYCFIDRAFT_154619 [Pseudocercospora fijiensis CIRAD86]|uniref:Membrane insertase YidC/Oxa/ALB C-terminal domain-containing protein n=1 Tax=Pseudocercospora fijiensis (strain CIRAD86) TaxID=383855 RepID=M3ABN8_PSEFD|nr:uncharacterized protein MYCFIDRAFT_154619 [Pseudocercospora fijiensis CIRAD86]EME81996.1 hypothetical protein MYCFIDRAFT_154619 [Pseudocercospora fijiensis CIRAD86]
MEKQLSSTPRPNSRTASNARIQIVRTSTPWTRSIPVAIPSIAAIRYASTAPAAQQTAQAAATTTTSAIPPPESTATFANLDTINLDNIGQPGYADPSAIPEGIGYLKQIGIDFGFGPTSAIEWVIEHLHIWGGLPWWGSILATGALMRIIMFPLYLKMSDSLARQQALGSVTKPFYERMNVAKKSGNTAEVMQAWQQVAVIHKRAGVSVGSQFLPMAVQGVLGFCGFRLMRAMVALPVPGLHDGGFLWITNLTMTDGYLILPAVMAGVIHVIGRIGGEAGTSAQMPPNMKKLMIYGMPALIFIFTAFQPGAIALWFCGTGAVGLIQSRLLQQPGFRKFWNLAPLYKPAPGEGAEGGLFGAMLGNSVKNAQEKAAARASSASHAGKSASFSQASYQAPDIQKSRGGKTIDATLVDKSASDMVQPQKKGMFDGITNLRDKASKSFADVKKRAAQITEQTPEQKAKAIKDDFKKRAEAYERRAHGRKGR